jgi:hypothetical protein
MSRNANRSREFPVAVDDSPKLKGGKVLSQATNLPGIISGSVHVFAGLADGWGFPVAECRSFWKGLRVLTCRCGLRADLRCYFAPDDFHGTGDLINGLIVNPARDCSARASCCQPMAAHRMDGRRQRHPGALSKAEVPGEQ